MPKLEPMAPPLGTRLKRAFQTMTGRAPKDIQLPNESGRRDPRLPPTIGQSLKRAGEGYKTLKSLGSTRSPGKR